MTVALIIVFLGLELLSLLSIPSVLARRRGHPISASAWLIALVALPGVAWVMWFVFGRTRLSRKTRRHAQARDRVSQQLGRLRAETVRLDELIPLRARGRHSFSTSGNQVTLLADGDEAFSRLEGEIRAAERCIHLFFFTFAMDRTGRRILSELVEKSQRGVKVRLMVDGLGSQASERQIKKSIAGTGIDFAVFLPKKLRPLHLPRLNFVNHRKIVVIDDRIAFTGGMNIGNEYAQEWRDLMLVLGGPAVFWLNNVFLEDWYFATDELLKTPECVPRRNDSNAASVTVLASGPSTEGWIEDAYFNAIVSSRKRLWISSPYLLPTEALRRALRSAAGRGVDVRIVIPRKSDVLIAHWAARPYLRSLLRDGVHLYEYEGMVHGKALVADDYCAVGSANLDYRSMHLSFELCCLVDDENLTKEVSNWLEGLFAKSHRTREETLDARTSQERLLETVAHLFSPLL